MKIINCKNCGGSVELAPDKTFGTCEYCGSVMTFPKVDDEQRAAAFNRGNHFRRIGEFDKALAVYERIVREDENDAEAHWCCALCRFGIEYVEDPATMEWLPTCHRASFDSFLEDVDYLAAVEHSDGITRRQYQKDAARIAEVQRGILAMSQNTEPYDVFICYKETDEKGQRTRDSLLAQDIYYQLTEQGRKVFFARITLEEVAGTQYEPYIFAALNSAKVMIVVGTKAEYLNAVWVKNEWSRFLAMMKKDHGKLLLPCYRDMDPYDLPEQLSVLQSYDMAKIGFIQDLTRGIAKVLDVQKQPVQTAKETVVVQQATNSNVVALLKRGNMALEDGEWDKADQFFEDVLNQDAECAEAYLGKYLAELHYHQLVQAVEAEYDLMIAHVKYEEKQFEIAEEKRYQLIEKAIKEHGDVLSANMLEVNYPKVIKYQSTDKYWTEQLDVVKNYVKTQKNLSRAEKFASVNVKEMVQDAILQWETKVQAQIVQAQADDLQNEQSDWYAEQVNCMLQEIYRERELATENAYKKICDLMEQDNIWTLRKIVSDLRILAEKNYKDCSERLIECEKKLNLMENAERERSLKSQERIQWIKDKKCAYCGGVFSGVFTKKCVKCGKEKSY